MAIIETEASLHEAHRDNHTHRDVNGGRLRPAVFGAMDGLVSNLALMTGVAGGTASQQTVVIGGLRRAGRRRLLHGSPASTSPVASSASWSRPSWTWSAASCASTRPTRRPSWPRSTRRAASSRAGARGGPPAVQRPRAGAGDTRPRGAGHRPPTCPRRRVAAVSSFGSFALGALLPVLPFLLGASALWPAVLLALAGLFPVAARWSPRSRPAAGGHQLACGSLALGGAAAGVTYLLGSLFGDGRGIAPARTCCGGPVYT